MCSGTANPSLENNTPGLQVCLSVMEAAAMSVFGPGMVFGRGWPVLHSRQRSAGEEALGLNLL